VGIKTRSEKMAAFPPDFPVCLVIETTFPFQFVAAIFATFAAAHDYKSKKSGSEATPHPNRNTSGRLLSIRKNRTIC
jgi:hypothetical protein